MVQAVEYRQPWPKAWPSPAQPARGIEADGTDDDYRDEVGRWRAWWAANANHPVSQVPKQLALPSFPGQGSASDVPVQQSAGNQPRADNPGSPQKGRGDTGEGEEGPHLLIGNNSTAGTPHTLSANVPIPLKHHPRSLAPLQLQTHVHLVWERLC